MSKYQKLLAMILLSVADAVVVAENALALNFMGNSDTTDERRKATAVPSHGPKNGYLVINGGDFSRFIQLAGGANAHIVMIPTAGMDSNSPSLNEPCNGVPLPEGAQCVVLHTTDRKEADSEAFVAHLETATGVWFGGGRQWRLADAYLNTRTHQELFRVLDRGGVIDGVSAGAAIQASFLVRGQGRPVDDNTVVIATDGHTVGFGFLTNAAVDVHVEGSRQNDLSVVMRAHPEILGIGLESSSSIIVHGDEFVVDGPGRVAIWDGKDREGRSYYYLHVGDRFNLATREAALARGHAPAPGPN